MKNTYPKKIHIETVLGCNSRCIMCPNHSHKRLDPKIMDQAIFRRIIDEAITWPQLKSIKLSLNGETLLDPHIADRIKYIKDRRNIRITFNTNGQLLNSHLSQQLIHAGLSRINIHISGFGAKNYQQIMSGLSYKKVLNNVHELQNIAKKINPKFVIAIKYVVLRQNEMFLKRAERYWTSRDFLFRPDKLNDRAGNLVNYRSLAAGSEPSKRRRRCPLIFDHLFVRYNGDVVTCWNDWDSVRVMGRIPDHSLSQIYNNAKFRTLRNNQQKKSLNNICLNCDWEDKDEK